MHRAGDCDYQLTIRGVDMVSHCHRLGLFVVALETNAILSVFSAYSCVVIHWRAH